MGDIIARGMAGDNSADLAAIAQYLNTPVATYTHTSNKEVIVSAVDINTDTFTSIAHGLANGDIIFPILNSNAGAVYPLQVYAGGMTQTTFYVVNKTDNTFQLSLASGGAAFDLTNNPLMDLTKWHFENYISEITIANLPPAKQYRVIIRNYKSAASGFMNFYANSKNGAENAFASVGQTSYSSPIGGTVAGSITTYLEFVISTIGKMFIRGNAAYMSANNSQANQLSYMTFNFYSQCVTNYQEGADITSIILGLSYKGISNGSIVEVYRA